MLEQNAGQKCLIHAVALPGLRRAIGISLLFLGLGGCMTLGGAPPPVAVSPQFADSQPSALQSAGSQDPAVNLSTAAATQPEKVARDKKRARRAQRSAQVSSVTHESQAKVSSIDPGHLIGMEPGAVRELLGPPLRVESYDLSREWIYTANGCSFSLFFYPNLNTAAFRVLKYGGSDGNGELMDVSDICIRHILTVRKNATG